MATVSVKRADSHAYDMPTVDGGGVHLPPLSWDVEISAEARPARPGTSLVVHRSGGMPETWDGRRPSDYWVLKDAGTDSGMMAHPISGVDRLDPAELRVAREQMALTLEQMSGLLLGARGRPIVPRTLRDFESGAVPVPEQIRRQVESLLHETACAGEDLFSEWCETRPEYIDVYRTDEAFHAARPEYARWPARWWLHVAARFAEDMPVRLRTVDQPS